ARSGTRTDRSSHSSRHVSRSAPDSPASRMVAQENPANPGFVTERRLIEYRAGEFVGESCLAGQSAVARALRRARKASTRRAEGVALSADCRAARVAISKKGLDRDRSVEREQGPIVQQTRSGNPRNDRSGRSR